MVSYQVGNPGRREAVSMLANERDSWAGDGELNFFFLNDKYGWQQRRTGQGRKVEGAGMAEVE